MILEKQVLKRPLLGAGQLDRPIDILLVEDSSAIDPDLRHGANYQAVSILASLCNPSCSMASSRSLNFWILPVTVVGKCSVNRT